MSYGNVEPIFGIEIAEDLLKKYASVTINFEKLCADLENFFPTMITSNIKKIDILKKEEILLTTKSLKEQQIDSDILLVFYLFFSKIFLF